MLQTNEQQYKYATREKNPTNDDLMIYYSEDYPYSYIIAVDGETVITLSDIPVGAQIVHVVLEIKPLRPGVPASIPAQYAWDPTSRVLTLGGPVLSPDDVFETFAGQLVSVIYKIKKTTL